MTIRKRWTNLNDFVSDWETRWEADRKRWRRLNNLRQLFSGCLAGLLIVLAMVQLSRWELINFFIIVFWCGLFSWTTLGLSDGLDC